MVILKTNKEIKKLKASNQIVAEVLSRLKEEIRPGTTTIHLDNLAEQIAYERGGLPAFKGYRGFPSSICASINEEVVHGIPSKRKLKEGDIISIDFGILKDGYYGDSAFTIIVGKGSNKAEVLLKTTKECLDIGINKARPGNRLSDISNAIQVHAESNGYSLVREFGGHGIGRNLHEDPHIPNFGPPGQGIVLKAGMTMAIEPMLLEGSNEIEILNDGWTVVTKDRKLSAHFEHTVVITNNGPVVLSKV